MLITTRQAIAASNNGRIYSWLCTFLVLTLECVQGDQDPRQNFCRRWGHQTTVIDDKLYIDGGYVNFADTFQKDHQDWPNTWNSYHDLNHLSLRGGELWPDLNISLNKDSRTVPTVHGGILWGDSVNKRYYVYGGQSTQGYPAAFKMWSYDTLKNNWDDFGAPKATVPPNIASYGAGVGVSETGQGFYYGGWISNSSMNGWTRPQTMSSDFYRYDYSSNTITLRNPPDKLPRAEGAMVWIPAGDTGLLIYIGGVVDTFGNGSLSPQPMNKTLIYDPSTNAWFSQTAVGTVPQSRRKFCASVAWAPDLSSYNIYLWGGLPAPPPAVNVTAFNDVYILSIPSFTWIKVFPGHDGNSTYKYGHYSASCNMVKDMSQLIVIGGTYPSDFGDGCDLATDAWAQHNLWTGGANNQETNDKFWALFDPNITTNVIPSIIYNVTGGDKNGAATVRAPPHGYDNAASSKTGLAFLLSKNASLPLRSPTRSITGATATGTPTSVPTKLSAGAIAGIVIGSTVFLSLVALIWCLVARRVVNRRRRRSEAAASIAAQSVAHTSLYGGSASLCASPQSVHRPSMHHYPGQPEYGVPQHIPCQPTEMDAQQMQNTSPTQVGVSPITGWKPPAQLSPISPSSPAEMVELPGTRRSPAPPAHINKDDGS